MDDPEKVEVRDDIKAQEERVRAIDEARRESGERIPHASGPVERAEESELPEADEGDPEQEQIDMQTGLLRSPGAHPPRD